MTITPLLVLLLALYDPESGRSPATLLAVPGDGIAYYKAKERARELILAQKAEEAEPLAERVVREYPRDGENWRLLAHAKRALKKHAEAAAAFEQAATILGGYQRWFNAAASHLAAGNRKAALARVRDQMTEEQGAALDFYNAKEFESLRNDPEFLRILGIEDPKSWSRDEGWRHDLDYVVREVKRVNPDYRDRPLPAEFTRRYEELKRNVPKLSDEQLLAGINRLVHVLEQGHTDLSFISSESKPKFKWLPVRLYFFPEGVFVINASDEYKPLIGARVVSIGNVSAAEAWRRVAETRSVDGAMEYLWQTPVNLVTTPFLKGLGIIESVDAAELTIQRGDEPPSKVVVNATTEIPPYRDSLNMGRDDEKHFERAVPEHDALYVRFAAVANDKDETLAAFGKRLWLVLQEKKPRNVIVDMRLNRGGASSLYPELLRTLIAFSRVEGNQLYVLIGRSTYSAAGNFITDLERLANPIFVGEASSDCCNLHGDPIYIQLPYSKIEGVLTSLEWNLSTPWDRRREMSPEVPVQLTAKDYFAGRDTVLETVYRMISR